MQNHNSAEGLSIGIIMDGNGRWAQKRGLPRTAGHKRGADVFDAITRHARDVGVRAISYYAFSTENWVRPKEEIDAIMDLFGQFLRRLYKYRKEDNRVVFMGDRSPLLPEYRQMMDEIESETKDNTGMILNMAINYGAQQELTFATQKLAAKVAAGTLLSDAITPEMMQEELFTRGQPMLDLLIRTSGEMRVSNFMLWQAAYAELLFTPVLWPDFTSKDFDAAVAEFHGRSRRFGGV